MNKKKIVSILVIILTVALLVTLLASCASKTTTDTAQELTVTAQRGDITVDISAVGNLAYSQEEELSFDTGGTVAEVLVDIGDSVTEGDVVARLDMTEWQQKITNLESALVTRQQALTQAEQNLSSAERNVTRQEDAVITAEKAVDDAEYNVGVQERSITQAQIDIANAEMNYNDLFLDFHLGTTNDVHIGTRLYLAEQSLELARAKLDDAYRNVDKAKEAVITAEKAVESAKLDVIDARTAVSIAETGLTKAQQDVTDAQSTLDEANATHPELAAPFDGLIIAINTKAGSEIYKGGAVVTIVDPNKFKAEILVGETDIMNVKLNGDATVELDALSGIIIPAKVTSISPTATVTQGVVSYEVTVELSSQQFIQQGSTQLGSFTPGELPEGFTPGQIPEGLTPGEMPEGFIPGQVPEGMMPGQGGTQEVTELSVQLREGLTATVSIIIDQRTDVIYVPNQAVKIVQGASTVNVSKDGVVTERTVTTGISNSKYTEIVDGLDEGEQVVYTRSSSSGSSTFGPGGGAFFMGP
ncbi:MAG: HlyD family efflux transporter periplasmic adaptor subunit [Dehalococcoidales bacterium]|nr:HlyD family efflux transporter periplasmic adaptor subunit [Dehalococcoidales bacterium]